MAALFFIGTLIVYASLIKPEMDTVGTQRAQVAAAENLFNTQQSATQDVKKAFKGLQDAAGVRGTIALALPLGPSMTQALHQIDAMVVASRVSIDSFVITPVTPEASKQPLVKRLGKLNVEVSISGNYDSVKGFLKLMETNIRIVNVKSFEFTSNKGQPNIGPYSMKIVADMFYQEN